MEWRLCENPQGGETQECFNRHLLQRADGSGSKLPVVSGSGWYRTQLRLPAGLRCNHCVIQWNYRAGKKINKISLSICEQLFYERNYLCLSVSRKSFWKMS